VKRPPQAVRFAGLTGFRIVYFDQSRELDPECDFTAVLWLRKAIR